MNARTKRKTRHNVSTWQGECPLDDSRYIAVAAMARCKERRAQTAVHGASQVHAKNKNQED